MSRPISIVLTLEERADIREQVYLGGNRQKIADEYKVSISTINTIVNEGVRNHIQTPINSRSSLCCKATIVGIHQPNAMENEVSYIQVCTACNAEAPSEKIFMHPEKIAGFFIELNRHKSNNN